MTGTPADSECIFEGSALGNNGFMSSCLICLPSLYFSCDQRGRFQRATRRVHSTPSKHSPAKLVVTLTHSSSLASPPTLSYGVKFLFEKHRHKALF